MEETNEKLQKQEKVTKKGKHKAKPTLGDIVFRVLVVVVIFFIVLLNIRSFFAFFYSDVWYRSYFEYHSIF